MGNLRLRNAARDLFHAQIDACRSICMKLATSFMP